MNGMSPTYSAAHRHPARKKTAMVASTIGNAICHCCRKAKTASKVMDPSCPRGAGFVQAAAPSGSCGVSHLEGPYAHGSDFKLAQSPGDLQILVIQPQRCLHQDQGGGFGVAERIHNLDLRRPTAERLMPNFNDVPRH